eukprot:4857642-Amphidinium_carterae.1
MPCTDGSLSSRQQVHAPKFRAVVSLPQMLESFMRTFPSLVLASSGVLVQAPHHFLAGQGAGIY